MTPAPAEVSADADALACLVGASVAHQEMLAQLRRIAGCDAPALLEGETGTGKELAARSIHYGGRRRGAAFVPVNCGALPDSLVESELFGHERGAFTDARQARRGLVAEASGGTLFLDEVDALSPKAQVTLLRYLQDQHYRPVGAAREQRSDVRVLAASNRPLAAAVEAGSFRADLMYRLNILHLALPPLRERLGDAALLARHFIGRFAAKYRSAPKVLHPLACEWMARYSWPGNVRELENWVHRAFLMTHGPEIMQTGHAAEPGLGADPAAAHLPSFRQAKAEAVRLFEHDYLRRMLQLAEGNVTRAARLAGKERRAFGRLLKKHGLASPSGDAA